MILLTDEQMKQVGYNPVKQAYFTGIDIIFMQQRIAKEQLKKVAEWGEEECTGHEGYQYSLHRRQCNMCWQALNKEVE